MSLFSLVLAATLAAGAAPPKAVDCSYDRDAMLALSLDAFDQDMEGGWRALDNRGCSAQAADLIAAYRLLPKSVGNTLLPWHEAQIRADLGQTVQAIALMRQSYKPTAQDRMGWNLYVDGSIAFLQGDRAALERARAALAGRVPPEGIVVQDGHYTLTAGGQQHRVAWPPNLNVLDALLRCFGTPYRNAYGNPACRTP